MKTRTESGLKTRTESGLGPLPRGYRIRIINDGRLKPAMLLIRGKTHESYATEKEAHREALALIEKEGDFGKQVRDFDPAEWLRYCAAKRDYFGGKEPDWLLVSRLVEKIGAPLTVRDAVKEYTDTKRTEGVSEDSLGHYKPIFDRFTDFVGDRDVNKITRDDINAFMALQADASSETRKTRFARIRALFNWLVGLDRISASPFKGISTPKVKTNPVVILTAEQTQQLFSANSAGPVDQRRRETLGRLALEAFCGLRNDTAWQIVASEIHPDGLRIPAAKIKTQQDQFLEGLPTNLHAWLAWSKPKEWAMNQRQYLEEKRNAFIRANVPHPRNCLRKGFVSYHVAAYRNKNATALISCHTSTKLLEKTYRGVAREADGVLVFAIYPPKD